MLLSLHAEYTQAILAGDKTIELRRSACGCEPGTPVLIYTSFPVKRVQAAARVAAVHALSPAELWTLAADTAAVTRAQFDAYLSGLDVAYGLELTDVQAISDTPLGFNGPQSWRYLYADEPAHQPLISLL